MSNATPVSANPVKGGKDQSLTVTDNRDGKTYTLPITNGNAIKGADLKKMGLKSYDPGYANTLAAKSKITYISGGEGILRYRGYPIEELAEKSTFLEVAFLLIYGELPTKEQAQYFTEKVMKHTYVHEDLKTQMHASRYDSHPMGMLIGSMSAMSNVHPEANPALRGNGVYKDQEMRNKQMYRIIGTIATCSAFSYRHRIGRPYVAPAAPEMNLSYSENFLYMLDKVSE
jgi:citrate synthase